MNCVLPQKDFLQQLRTLCYDYGALLIFDEVMTGFRVALGGAQSLFNITPDLTTLGKIIGGGLPVGAFGGKKDILAQLAPQGPVYQAGTLSGNPVTMAAGLATLQLIQQPNFYEKLASQTHKLVTGLQHAADQANVPFHTHHIGSMFGLFFSSQKTITRYNDVMQCNTDAFKHFFQGMLQQGVLFAPSTFETGFVSAAHTDEIVTKTIKAAEKTFETLKN